MQMIKEIYRSGTLEEIRPVRWCKEKNPQVKKIPQIQTMEKMVAVVDGFTAVESARIIKQIHWMGGRVMRKLTSRGIARHRPTHLVAYSALCRAYPAAVDNNLAVVSDEWIAARWAAESECRKGPNFHTSNQIRPPPYAWARNITFSLVGFDTASLQHWTSAIASAGGSVHADLLPSTRIIVLNKNFRSRFLHFFEGGKIFRLKFDREAVQLLVRDGQHVVTCEFLTRSLADHRLAPVRCFTAWLGGRDEEDAPPGSGRRKRDQFSDPAAADEDVPSPPRPKRRRTSSSFSDVIIMPLTETPPSRQLKTLALSSPASSHQQRTPARPVFHHHHARLPECDENEPAALRHTPVIMLACSRHQRALELLHTERNYAGLLRSLLQNVVGPLEAEGSHERSGFLAVTDLDIVFGKLQIICR